MGRHDPPSRVDQAIGQIDAWLETAAVVMLGEGETCWPRLRDLLTDGKIHGPAVHDARIETARPAKLIGNNEIARPRHPVRENQFFIPNEVRCIPSPVLLVVADVTIGASCQRPC
jgi:hypothetical protein